MTTPGHQAGPTPANGGHAPGTEFPDRHGAPGAEDPGQGTEDTRGYDPPEDGFYGTPPGSRGGYPAPPGSRERHGAPPGGYGDPEEAEDWFGPPRDQQGGYGAPDQAAGRPSTPLDRDGWSAGPQAGQDRYADPAEAPGLRGTPASAQGRYGRPAAGGRYGQNPAGMSTPEAHGRPARHAADPGQADPAGTGGWSQTRPTRAFHAETNRAEPYRSPASRAYQSEGYQSEGYQSEPYRPEGYPSEADRIDAKWTGADRRQAPFGPPQAPAGPPRIPASPPQAAAAPPQAAAWNPAAPARAAALPGFERTSGSVPDAPAGGSGQAAAPANSSLLRSSSVMAVGTIASRVTGFVRSAILLYAIGTHDLGNAYNLANTLPNIVYNLALGGILTSVVVPLLVNAAKRDRDRGEAYDQRIFTLGVLALGGITLVATLAAQPIASVYASNIGTAAAYHLTVLFAYFFIPQIFFYGVSSLAGAILNARGSFAAPMWTPVINNLVVIVVGLGFMVTAGLNRTPENISPAQVQLLGIGTTLGIVLQTVALIPSLRRVGFRWRPRRDFRRAEVSEIGHMSGWMFGYVLTTQIAFLVTTRVANSAGAAAARVSPQGAGAGVAAYSNAYMLFQLPYAIVGISVITALLPRMSAHASERKYGLVSSDFSTAARLASVIVVPAALILAVLGAPLAEGVFGYGSTSIASARYVGEIFAVFSLGLLPFTLFQLLLRVFYAMHDSRTPALISVITMVINILTNVIALAVLPPQRVVAGLGAGFGLASLTGTVVAWRVLSRRIGGLDGYTVRSGLVRMHLAAVPAAIFALAVAVMVGGVTSGGRLAALVTVAVGGSGALLLYVLFAKAFGVAELDEATASLRARFH